MCLCPYSPAAETFGHWRSLPQVEKLFKSGLLFYAGQTDESHGHFLREIIENLVHGELMKPIVFDLDRSLSRVDTLVEQIVELALTKPFSLVRIAVGAKSRLDFKRAVFAAVNPEPRFIPMNSSALALLHKEASSGREVLIASAALKDVAESAVGNIGITLRVLASEDSNLRGGLKASELTRLFGKEGFDYVGDSRADLEVWKVARNAYLVGNKRNKTKFEAIIGKPITLIPSDGDFRSALDAMRPGHWIKNALLFLTPVLAGALNLSSFFTLLVAFAAISLVASSLYLLNDILDLQSDRMHPEKSRRAIASGLLDLRIALGLVPLLLVLGVILAFLSSGLLGLTLISIYAVLSAAYSFLLKRIPVVDVVTLSLLYVFRIIAGGLLVGIVTSFWLLIFSFLSFLSLALLKRTVELAGLQVNENLSDNSMSRRGYSPNDLQWARPLGVSLSASTILMLALYVEDKFELGTSETLLPFLLIPVWSVWVSKLWFDEAHGRVDSDPVRYALKNKLSLGLLLTLGIIYASIILLGGI